MNCMRIDPNYTTSKNGKHRKELKAVLRSIYDTLGHYPGYRTIMTALHERGYKCGRQMARELLRTLWYEDEQSTRNTRELVHCYTRNTTPRPASGIVLQCCEFDSVRVRFSRLKTVAEGERFELPEPCGSTVFKTAAIDHSANPPGTHMRNGDSIHYFAGGRQSGATS